jgi:hypothetical protein
MKTTSSWKYLSANTEVLLANGSVIRVAELNVGDTILGSNEDVRTVLSLFPFKSQNYRIIPRFKKSFVINEFQSLPVMTMDEKVFLIHVNQFYNYVNRNDFSLLHDEVNFTDQQVTLEPYILGCWLATNVFTRIQFLTKSPQIARILEFISKFSVSHVNYGDYIIINDDRIINQFHKYDLFAFPRIPDEYKYNSRSVRTRVFNGFCDSHVYSSNNNRISIVGETLMNDFRYLVHSLGYLSECKVLMSNIFTVTYTYSSNSIVRNDFKVAKVNDNECVCIQLNDSNEVGILLSDFTVV